MTASIIVLASGRGTNLQALIDACASGALPARIVAVYSHTPTALALERARRHGIPATFVAPPQKHSSQLARDEWDAALADRIAAAAPDVIVFAGWMRIVGEKFIERFPDARHPGRARILNLHPASPGELPGHDAIVRAFEQAEEGTRTETGVMVHVVAPEVDSGPVIAHERVAIPPGIGFEGFEAAMHEVEHRLIVRAVAAFLAGEV